MSLFDRITESTERALPKIGGARFAVVVDTYESDDYPVVRHVFYGKTREEAQGYYDSHLKTDKFLASCAERGKFADFTCKNKKSIVTLS